MMFGFLSDMLLQPICLKEAGHAGLTSERQVPPLSPCAQLPRKFLKEILEIQEKSFIRESNRPELDSLILTKNWDKIWQYNTCNHLGIDVEHSTIFCEKNNYSENFRPLESARILLQNVTRILLEIMVWDKITRHLEMGDLVRGRQHIFTPKENCVWQTSLNLIILMFCCWKDEFVSAIYLIFKTMFDICHERDLVYKGGTSGRVKIISGKWKSMSINNNTSGGKTYTISSQ